MRYHIKDRLLLAKDKVRTRKSKHDPLLVFTMAKVGSLSVHKSVKSTTPLSSFHIHTLDLEQIAKDEQRCFDQGTYPDSRNPASFINKNIIDSGVPYKIISLFRNPVERNISAFFEAFKLMTGTTPQEYTGSVEDLVNLFHEKVSHTYAIDWFGKQFAQGTGISVYDHPFDQGSGYDFIKQENCSILLINSSVDDQAKESIIRDFLKMPSFKLVNTNITANSGASELYQRFKAHIRFDEAYLNRLLDSQYFAHFFTQADKERTTERWLRPS